MADTSADDIASCCLSLYDKLPAKGTKPGIRSDDKQEWTILAGVVMEDQGQCVCLSLCSGVKALPFKALSPNGDVLHDCHAEVLARRGARLWLLKRLVSEVNSDNSSQGAKIDGMLKVFERRGDLRWSLRAGIKLHLYCSTLPCGDASSSLLLKYGNLACQEYGFPISQSNGDIILRGRSALSISQPRLRTKPGKVHSLPSISMSCTDKLAMWSAVGMQGSILSRWLEPIFFDKLVIGLDSLNGASPDIIRETVDDCERVLLGKLSQDHAAAETRPLRVVSTALSFAHSKERVLNTRSDVCLAGSRSDQVAPAAGSIVCILGEKTEHLIQGRKQGVVMPKNSKLALTAAKRSILSKASFYALVKEAETILEGNQGNYNEVTYFQAKHDLYNAGQRQYRMSKHLLRGSIDQTLEEQMVKSFLTESGGLQLAGADKIGDSLQSAFVLPQQAPFYGWLVSGQTLESFS